MAADGGVFSYGQASFLGSGSGRITSPVVGIEPSIGHGYWLASRDGGVFTFGSAQYHGSAAGRSSLVVGLSRANYGNDDYRLTDEKGMVWHFGEAARDHGDLRTRSLDDKIAGVASTPLAGADQYWLFDGKGEVYPFGEARSFGSTASLRLNAPIVGMAVTISGKGYWLVAADGGVFAFGDAKFLGSAGSLRLNSPIVGIEANDRGDGYWLVAADGGVFTFGRAGFFGSAGNIRLNAPIVGIAICHGPGVSLRPA